MQVASKRTLYKAIFAWCLYDWACASFPIIITTFIFATYFTSKIATDPIVGTYQWGTAISIAGMIIAFGSPLFGAIADRGGHHKGWLFGFTLIAVIAAALLWFAYPSPQSIFFTLTCMVVGTVGYEIALVFYNSFLPIFAPDRYLGRISGYGWSAGYLGGIFALSLALIFFIRGDFFSLDKASAEQIRICGPFVAVWFSVFALPLFFMIPDIKTTTNPLPTAVTQGIKALWDTVKRLPQEKNMMLYLIAHMLYTDGLNTLFAFGGIYAAGVYGLSFQEVLLFGISMNVTAGVGAFALGYLDDYLGSKKTVLLCLVCLMMLGIPMTLLESKTLFWITSLLLCLFVGPVQSASRSMMVRLMTDKMVTAEMFGLYALSGKITAFIGPWVLGYLTLLTNSQRIGMASVLFFFMSGAILLLFVNVPLTLQSAE
ncbi:MAG: MFS transporter [Gammaproteobacteria bacterium]|nr:MFS transporter [Gammaproteobacteria bacterium]